MSFKFKVSSKLHAKLILEQDGNEIETNHVFSTQAIDQGLLKIQKGMIATGYKAGDPPPPEMIEQIIGLYDASIQVVEGYECDDGEFSPVSHVPFDHKMRVVTGLMKQRFGSAEKNSPKASGE